MSTAAPTAGRARVYDPTGFYDEALTPDGHARPEYEDVLGRIGEDPAAARAAVDAAVEELGARFGAGEAAQPFICDPVPRILGGAEWEPLEAGLAQRARALNAFIDDVYGEGAVVREGVVPRSAIDGAEHFEPQMSGVELPHPPATVVGFDLVRCPDGRFRVLEDNLRTPSGLAYAEVARLACLEALGEEAGAMQRPLDPAFDALAEALRAAAPAGDREPAIVLLSDGPGNSAWFEHRRLARRLGVPIVRPDQLDTRRGRLRAHLDDGNTIEVDIVYRRTDEDRLRDEDGRATRLAELLLEPVRRGTLAVVNAFGSGIADDKLIHAHVEEIVRLLLGEEPLIESVPTLDLGAPAARARARARQAELVIKPRAGHGGVGVTIGSQASELERRRAARLIETCPDGVVAQEIVRISRHPTVCGGRLEPRHVDLRAFAIVAEAGVEVVPGGLTRVALERGSLMVNSTQGGGGKDTWVLA